MKRIILSLIFFLLIVTNLNSEDTVQQESNQVEIISFAEVSALREAGGRVGDIIIKYNNREIGSLKTLYEVKQGKEIQEVEVVLLRGNEQLILTIPGGDLGVYLREYASDHEFSDDAVIIPDIGPVSWGLGPQVSFFGCLQRIEEHWGQGLSYETLLGLSAYGFRCHFFPGFCPSSPDPTVGKDLGDYLLRALGYDFDYFVLNSELNEQAEEQPAYYKSREEMQELITSSLDRGWPVLAIDLIKMPDWGIITGYQDGGETLLCRTYYDETRGYEKARKFPWVIIVFNDRKETDLQPLYRSSLRLAREMLETEMYDNYYSGVKALEQWILDLQNDENFDTGKPLVMFEIQHANWWIYYCLTHARELAASYLQENISRFGSGKEDILQLAELYQKEALFLSSQEAAVPAPEGLEQALEWSQAERKIQADILRMFLEMEKEIYARLQKMDI